MPPTIARLFGRLTRSAQPAAQLPQPGLYHYQQAADGGRARLHLRLNPDSSGVLLVNASRVYHLNPTAAFMAYCSLEKIPEGQALSALTRLYHVPWQVARTDYQSFCQDLAELSRPDGACPVHDLALDVNPPFSANLTAPYRMDLALTYRCNNRCPHCYNDRPRSYPELSTVEWKQILERIHSLGVPHVVFTGGEPTQRADLAELIAHANRLGLIAGMNTNGRRLADPGYLSTLVAAGLEHVQITVESHEAAVHDALVASPGAWEQTIQGLCHALNSSLFVMTNTTLLAANANQLVELLEFLGRLGVPTIGLNALIHAGHGKTVDSGLPEADLQPLLHTARRLTDANHQRLIWYSPTQYCQLDPVQMELGVKGCTAALYNMCIESDGSVLPCQSYYTTLGSILSDSWESIWNHPLALHIRERRYLPDDCQACALARECGAGCPLRLADCAPIPATHIPSPTAPMVSL